MAVERLPCTSCGCAYKKHKNGKKCECGCSRWEGGWRARWRDATGRSYSKGSKDWTKRDAEAYERKMLDQRDRGVVVRAGDMTVAELAKLWREASRNVKPVTLERREAEVRCGILPLLGDVKLSKLTPSHIDLYLSKRKSAGLEASSISYALTCVLMPMLNFAVRRKFILANPAAEVEKVRVEETDRRFLSQEELNHLAAQFPEQWQGVVKFAGVMGSRFNETWDLRPEHVTGSKILIPGTKSKTSLRRISMPKFIQEIVEHQIEAYSVPDCLWGDMHRKTWRNAIWQPCMRKADLGHIRFHDLRHTAASLMIKAGLHPKTIQFRLGHASINITFDLYGHLFEEVDAAAADDLDAMWSNGAEGDS